MLRERSCDDKRSFFVRLTPAGDRVFCDVFPKVIARGKELFTAYSDADFAALEHALGLLRARIRGNDDADSPTPSPFHLKETP